MVDATVQKFGKLDILVNNAGISGSAVTDLLDTDAWDRLMAVNARGVFLGTKYAVLAMQQAGGGSIINLSSISGNAGQTHDAHGLQRLEGRGAHADQVDRGAIRPRQHPRQFRASRPDAADAHLGRHRRPGVRAKMLQGVPSRRAGEVDEVANAILFLASDEASYITGAELYVDGGYLAA